MQRPATLRCNVGAVARDLRAVSRGFTRRQKAAFAAVVLERGLEAVAPGIAAESLSLYHKGLELLWAYATGGRLPSTGVVSVGEALLEQAAQDDDPLSIESGFGDCFRYALEMFDTYSADVPDRCFLTSTAVIDTLVRVFGQAARNVRGRERAYHLQLAEAVIANGDRARREFHRSISDWPRPRAKRVARIGDRYDPIEGRRPSRFGATYRTAVVGYVASTTVHEDTSGPIAISAPAEDLAAVWNARTGKLLLAVPNTVQIAWTADGAHVALWRSIRRENTTGVGRRDWRWIVERRSWPAGSIVETHEIARRYSDVASPVAMNFSRGDVAALVCSNEERTFTVLVPPGPKKRRERRTR